MSRPLPPRPQTAALDPDLWAMLTDSLPSSPPTVWHFARCSGGHYRPLWEKYREQVLVAWIRARPGTRPSAWWRFDCPRDCPEGNYRMAYASPAEQRAWLREHGLLTPAETDRQR